MFLWPSSSAPKLKPWCIGPRVGLPMASSLLFLRSGDTSVVLLGAVLAPIIDAAILPQKTVTTSEAPSLSAIPSLSVSTKGTLTFGLAGQF